MTEINNTQVDDAQDIDMAMPMHNVIEYSNSNVYTKYQEAYDNTIEMNQL